MLFRERFHGPIARGEVTLTVRAWTRPQARVGGRYAVGPTLVEVTGIRQLPVGALEEGHARAAGFESIAALRAELDRSARRPLALADLVYAVDLRHAGPVPSPAQPEVTPGAVERARLRLAALDTSAGEDWTLATLSLIGRCPGIAARLLAPEVGLECLEFKARVRRLKALGLTNSLLTGYELTGLGQAMLAALSHA